MRGMSGIGRVCAALGGLAIFLLSAGAAFTGEGAAPGPAPEGAGALKLQPAEITSAATRAMMLSVARAGERMVAVGDRGIVLLSDDDGATFRQARSVPVRSTLTAVCFVDAKTGWAVGHWGVVLRTDDAGETWRVQRSDLSVDQPLFSVYFRDRDQGWAVGLWSLMLATGDGGRTWTNLRVPPPPGGGKADRNLLKIFASRIGTLLIAAEQGLVLRSVDGERWSYVNTGYKGSFWTGVALSNGTLMVGGLRGTIYRSRDEGRTWSESKTDMKSSITDIAEGRGKIIAVGLDGVTLESDNGGASFKGTQRADRLPFTALAITNVGRVVKFSKQGIVEDPPNPAQR